MGTTTQQLKKVPVLRFGGLSSDWKLTYLNSILSFKNGVNADKSQYGHGRKFINVLDIIENDVIEFDDVEGLVDISDKEFSDNTVELGDVVFQRSSETREEVGQANVYMGQSPVTFGGFVIRGKKIGDYQPLFLNYALKTQAVRKDLTSRSGGSTRYNIGQTALEAVGVYLPDIHEQQKIADFLGSVDAWLDNLRCQKTALETYKRGMMQKLFTQQVRVKDDNGNHFPEWQNGVLEDVIVRFSTGLNPRNNFKLGSGDYYYVTIKNITKGKLDFSNAEKIDSRAKKLINKRSDLQKDDLIISSIGNIGEAYLLKEDPQNWDINESVFTIRPDKNKVTPSFLYHLVASSDTKKHFMNSITGSSFKSIKQRELRLTPVALPSIEEQQKIAGFLTAIDQAITAKAKEIAKVEEWKRGLMQKMFV